MDITDNSSDSTMPQSLILFIAGWFFHLNAVNISFDTIYGYAFHVLSLISLSLVIVINWHKLKDILKNKKNRK